jgi:dolichyl-phosphate beta-glucosyltransferase
LDLSVIIPVYNTGEDLRASVSELEASLSHIDRSFEIILVDDGSRELTKDLVASLVSPTIKVIRLEKNSGKFGAIVAGMKAAQGSCRIFTDADLPYDLQALPYIESLVNQRKFDLVIGDRTLPTSDYSQGRSVLRQKLSRVFQFAVRMFNTGEIFDTQCGLKGFRAEVAEGLFPLLTFHRFAGDIELLYIALKYNLTIRRIPVRLQRNGVTTVSFRKTLPEVIKCCLSLKNNWQRGIYNSEKLTALSDQSYWSKV